MSLINQMLKDLARRSKPLTSPDAILAGLVTSAYAKPKKNKLRYLLKASSLFLLVTAIFAIVQQFILPELNQNQMALPELIAPASPRIHHPPMTPESPTDLALSPVVLTGITMQIEKETSNLRLLLSHNTLYRVTSNGKDRVMIVLENTKLITNLPQIDTVNSAVKIIRMVNQDDGNLKIVLTLNAGADLSRLELNEANSLPELQIDLLYKNATDDAFHTPPQQTEVVEEQRISSIKRLSYDTSIEDEYQEALQFSTQGLNDEAIIRLAKFLVKYPTYTAARKSLVTILLKQGKTATAQDVVNVGLQQQPLYPPYIELKAQILVEKGQIKEALDLLQKAPPPLETYPEYHAFIAALYQRQNKSKLAEKLYERLVKIQPNNSIWWMGLGIARESLNKNGGAIEAFSKANSADDLTPELKVYVENRINALL